MKFAAEFNLWQERNFRSVDWVGVDHASRDSVLASGPKFRGLKGSSGRWTFQNLKLLSTSPTGGMISHESRI